MTNQSESGQIVYEVSRRPNNRRKKVTIPAGKPLFTPSGGRVPPDWTGVWVTTDRQSPLQAMGRDSKNRRVYLYSTEHMGEANAAKFARLKEFSAAYPKLMRRIKRDMQTSEEALVFYLIAKTGFRIGGNKETRAAAQAYGASTLQCTHVDIDEKKLAFTFTGKKGTSVYKELKDGFLAEAVNRRCEGSNLRNIFKTNDDKIRAYLDKISGGAGFTVKDFRTYVGTLAALRKIRTMSSPRSVSEFKRFRKEVGRAVGQKLGNTPTIALKSYVAPEVFCTWEGDMGVTREKLGGISKDFFECVHYDRE
jgi:DNA topoisomerase-1